MKKYEVCPRCKRMVLDRSDCGESGIYGSRHLICEPCFHAEVAELDKIGTNDVPEMLAAYGPPNEDDPWS